MTVKTKLTDREVEAVRLYCIGYSYVEMAKEMSITADVAKEHLKKAKRFWNTKDGTLFTDSMSRRNVYARAQQEGII